MRNVLVLTGILAFAAAPAFADTLKEITGQGMVVTLLGDTMMDVTYTPNGKFTGVVTVPSVGSPPQTMTGRWRIKAGKLCMTVDNAGVEDCKAYPAGKKSGDTFDLSNQFGSETVRIK